MGCLKFERHYGWKRSSVQNIDTQFKKTGKLVISMQNCSRKRKIAPIKDRLICQAAQGSQIKLRKGI